MFLWPQSNSFTSMAVQNHLPESQEFRPPAAPSFTRSNFIRLHQNILNSLMQIKNLDLVPAPPTIQENVNAIIFRQGVCLWPGCGKLGFGDSQSMTKHLLTDHACCLNTTLQVEMAIKNLSNVTSEVFESFQVLQACLAHLDRLVNIRSKPPQSNDPIHSVNQQTNQSEISISPAKPVPLTFLPQQVLPHSSSSFIHAPRPRLTFNLFSPSRHIPEVNRTLLPQHISPTGNPFYQRLFPPKLTNQTSIRGKYSNVIESCNNSQSFSHIRKDRSTCDQEELIPSKKRKRVRDSREEHAVSELEDPSTREYYRNNDERPPFTYIDLIRQAIIESSPKGLPLVDIYNWIQNEFIYYRKNQMRWKNAVRHNLSLHKCFQRIGEHKGGIWIINDEEYSVRRPHRPSVQRKHHISIQEMSNSDVKDHLDDSSQLVNESVKDCKIIDVKMYE